MERGAEKKKEKREKDRRENKRKDSKDQHTYMLKRMKKVTASGVWIALSPRHDGSFESQIAPTQDWRRGEGGRGEREVEEGRRIGFEGK